MSISVPEPTPQAKHLHRLGFAVSERAVGRCSYCLNNCLRGQWAAWSAGIAWGHADCIAKAYQACNLIIDVSAACHRSGQHLAHSRSAEESWEALRAAGHAIGPMECLVDQRFDRECFGRYNSVGTRCETCFSRFRCRSYTVEMSTIHSALHGGQPSKIQGIAAEYCAGIDVETHPMDSWERPHRNDNGDRCTGYPGYEDKCKGLGCSYRGHTSGPNANGDIFPMEKSSRMKMMGWSAWLTSAVRPKGIPSCEHFVPIRIAALVMHERMRPSMNVVREMDKEEFKWLLEEQWSQMAMEKLAEWKRENGRNLPFCPEHIDLKGKVVKVKDRAWLRELWLVCPGTGIKRGV